MHSVSEEHYVAEYVKSFPAKRPSQHITLVGPMQSPGSDQNAIQQRDVDSATDLAFSCLIKATEHSSWKPVIPIKVPF